MTKSQDVKGKILILIFLIALVNFTFAQSKSTGLSVQISLNYKGKPIQSNQKYISKTDTLTLETIRFYVSSFEINYKDNSTFKENNGYHLIDFEKPESLLFSLKNSLSKEIKSVTFNVGVDSLASVSGAMSDDLDATNGMYWAWQSGYINMKIEGKSSSCKTRKNQFQFHIGGYLKPNYAMKQIHLEYQSELNEKSQIEIEVDLSKLFDTIQLKEINTIMIPGENAMKLAEVTTKMFSLK